ncbi:ABC transporter permease [Acidihalobacter ferrooxydans]|uniref:ABC transporter permease n=1 Tax=Acidihalobacter ferrooxydans TaxID=1765967 RepID=A0A1P8UEE2_9GAMM|nr:ABC transporter permease [Acidihalobacter ferrooxydans]APZ42217.1 ABC transporter permease [Acidihalobacter ferrooxydans]
MNTAIWISLLASVVVAATPLLLAATGELVCERAGLLNLGVEGMMAVGAVCGFIGAFHTGNAYVGLLVGVAAGAVCGLLFAWLTVQLVADQVATGLALTILGHGLSGFIGHGYAGASIAGLKPLALPGLAQIPLLGPILFDHTLPVYAALLLVAGVHWFLTRSRAGLTLRSVGEDPKVSYSLGLRVYAVRYAAAIFGGAMAGFAGAFLSTAYTPMWAEGMVAGQGWIAVGLVVFATWRPLRLLAGAWLFAGVGIGQLFSQAVGFALNTYLLSALPYLAVLLALVLISRDPLRIRLNTPASLGRPFRAET